MKCDIIIPTYQNAHVLPKTLDALADQVVPAGWQIQTIMSDDGSTDNTLELAESFRLPSGWQKKVITGPHTGSAGARNRALDQATANIVFFLGADILLRPGALTEHLKFHEQYSDTQDAALGMVRWDPRLKPSPLMEWMEHGGPQNDFDTLLGSIQADPRSFWYGSHLSLKQERVHKLRFSNNFSSYGWEDLSMGHHLAKDGLRLHALHHAIGLHHHWYSVGAIAQRQTLVGLNITRFQAQFPNINILPKRSLLNHVRRGLFVLLGGQSLLTWWVKVWGKTNSLPRAFLLFTATEFWRGVWRSKGGFFAYVSEYKGYIPKKS